MTTMQQTAAPVQTATAEQIHERVVNARRAMLALASQLGADLLTLTAGGDEDAEESLSNLTETIASLAALGRPSESPRAQPSRGVQALLTFAGEYLSVAVDDAAKRGEPSPRMLLDLIELTRKRLDAIAPLLVSDLGTWGAHDWIQGYLAPFRSADDATPAHVPA